MMSWTIVKCKDTVKTAKAANRNNKASPRDPLIKESLQYEVRIKDPWAMKNVFLYQYRRTMDYRLEILHDKRHKKVLIDQMRVFDRIKGRLMDNNTVDGIDLVDIMRHAIRCAVDGKVIYDGHNIKIAEEERWKYFKLLIGNYLNSLMNELQNFGSYELPKIIRGVHVGADVYQFLRWLIGVPRHHKHP